MAKNYRWQWGEEGDWYGSPSSLRMADCKQTPDGGYVIGTNSNSPISGNKTANSHGSYDYWIVKTDASGNVQWDKTIGGTGNEYLTSLELTPDGGYIVGGSSNSPASYEKSENSRDTFDYWVVKLSSTGVKQWDKMLGGNKVDALEALQKTADGGYIVAGYSKSVISGDKTSASKGQEDYWVVKLSNTGAKEWDKTIGGGYIDYCYDIKEVAPNTYYIGGKSYSDVSKDKTVPSYGSDDYWVVKLVYTPAAQTLTSQPITSSKRGTDNTTTTLIYPNPATTVLHIQNRNKATFILSDQGGKRLLVKTINGNGDINVANIPSGTYYLTNTLTDTTQKVIITR